MPLPHPEIFLHRRCRACGDLLREILNLGNHRLNAFPATVFEIETIQRVPLVLMGCQGCGLVQLDRTVPPDWLYRTYWYKSGVNEVMRAELAQIVAEALQLVETPRRVLDIGANDGTLLAAYPPGPRRIAVEPALNLHETLRDRCEELIEGYFPTPAVEGAFDIITAIAMCYDLEDPTAFFQAIHDHLAPAGVAIVQFQDFRQQVEATAFDNICHEHLEYYTLWSLIHILSKTGLTVQRVTQTPINGGSLRVVLRRQEDRVAPEAIVGAQLIHEAQWLLDTPTLRQGALQTFQAFGQRVQRVKRQILSVLDQTCAEGRVVDVYGASTKGNILLQVLGIGPSLVRQAIDRNPEKVGRRTITGIPIVGERQAHADRADVWLCPIWQFRESVLRRESWYLEQGGVIVFPLPVVEVVRGDWRGRGEDEEVLAD